MSKAQGHNPSLTETLASDAPEQTSERPTLPPTQEHDEHFAPLHLPTADAAERSDVAQVLPAGTAIKHYEIIRPLGRGGMGAVYLARDTKLGRLVALKLLLKRSEHGAQRLLVEARATARCKHENIVVIHEVDEHQGDPYMVLEYVEGSTLRAWLDRRALAPAAKRIAAAEHVGNLGNVGNVGTAGNVSDNTAAPVRVPPALALELIVPVVRALACAHEQGIVHRDLKPENILLADAGHVKVVDFGIAKLTGAALPPGADPGPTERDSLRGTYLYMAPEQWLRQPLDARADLWAVGVILYELCAGAHPLAPLSLPRLAMVADLNAPTPSLRDRLPDAEALAAVVDRCLAKRREARYRSAAELLVELEALLAAYRPLAPGQSPAPRKDAGPFAGLSAFQEADAGRFFGRDADVIRVVRMLRSQPLLALVGASGAGKSSFVRAGVVPALKRLGEHWEAFVLRPGRRPLAALAEILIQLQEAFDTDSKNAAPVHAPASAPDERGPAELASLLREQPGLFGARLRAHARRRAGSALLFVDQFEELYTLGVAPDERAAFLACLEGAADDASSPLRVVLALRADFLDRIAADDALLVDITRGLILLSPMGRAALHEVLVRPVEALGYHFESNALVDRMLDELEGTRSPLPLLQFAAAKLWDTRDTTQRRLTKLGYEQLGGVAGALSAHADATLAALAPRDRRLARALLVRLVTADRTRAVVALADLHALAEPSHAGDLAGAADGAPPASEPERVDPIEQVDRVVRRLIDARLLSLETDAGPDATIELVHESLIERWPQLRRWLDASAQDAEFLARLRGAAQQWEASGEAEGLLWRNQSADEARAWLGRQQADGLKGTALGGRERRYLRAVVALADRALRRRRRAVAVIIAALSAVALTVSSLALHAREEAARAQTEARRTRNATRMATAREKQADPTTVLALVRELEPPELPRGWSTMADGALRRGAAQVMFSVPDVVYAASFSPDGERIASASADKLVRVVRADGQGEALVLRGHEGWVYSIAWSPDGRHIVSGSRDQTVRIWNADGSGEPLILRGHQGLVASVAFSPDGQQIVTASSDGSVRVFRADGMGGPRTLRGHENFVYAASFSPDGQSIVSASYDTTVRVWRADGTGAPLVLRGHEGLVYAAAFSPDGTRIVSASFDKTVRIWHADGSGEPSILGRHGEFVASAAFSPDGRHVVSASGDKTVRLWNTDGSGEPIVLRGHEGFVHSAAFSPDGRRVVSTSADGTVRVWNANGEGYPTALRGHQHEVRRVAWSTNGHRIVTGSYDNTARVWNADGSGEPVILHQHPAMVTAATISPDGQLVATGSTDKLLRLFRADGAGEPLILRGHEDSLSCTAFSPDGRRVASTSLDKTVRIWQTDGTGEPLVLRGHGDAISAVAFSPDGRRVVTGANDNTARVWNADGTGPPIVLRGHEDNLTSVAWTPDGRRVVTGSYDKTARLWNADGTGTPTVLRGHDHWLHAVDVRPDGKAVATASQDGTVRIWNTDGTGEPLTLPHEAPVNAVAFSPDGQRLVSGSDDNTAWLWTNLEPLRSFEDPKLWTATTYCMPVARRIALLNASEAQARADEASCRRRVEAARAAP